MRTQQYSVNTPPKEKMRGIERVDRERAAFSLAAAYASSLPTSCSLSPTRTVANVVGAASASRRPTSARSTSSRRAAVGRSAVRGASSTRSRGGWVGEADEQLSLGVDFRRRREDTARKRRTMLGGGPGRDSEDIEDENRRLKVALSRAIDENKRYCVNKTRLEGELLRADAKIDLLLAELEQTPANRDQRLLAMARSEMEKCAVVRMLAKQKGHLQQLLDRQERELDMIKQTKEWSAVLEMTAATEEYFVEIQRLQRLLAQEQHRHTGATPSAVSPPGFHNEAGQATREEYNPEQGAPSGRRGSGVDEVVWSSRPGVRGSLSVPSPILGEHGAQEELAVGVCRAHHQQARASTAGEYTHAAVENREKIELVMNERDVWAERELHRRPLSPKRRISPPRRAQMVARALRGTEELRGSGETVRHSGNEWRRRRSVVEKGGASRSQVSIWAASAARGKRDSNFRSAVAGVGGRCPFSAPRRTRGTQIESVGGVRKVASGSLAGRAADGSGNGGGSNGGGGASRQRRRNSDFVPIPTRYRRNVSSVSVLEKPFLRGKGAASNSRLDPRPRSASPRVCSSSNSRETRDSADGDSRTRRDATGRSDFKKVHRGSEARTDDHDPDAFVGGFDTDSPAVAASTLPHNIELGASNAPASHDRDDERTDPSRRAQRRSSSTSPRESLVPSALPTTAVETKAAAVATAAAAAVTTAAAVALATAATATVATGAAVGARTDLPSAEVAAEEEGKEGKSAELNGHGQNDDTDEHGCEGTSGPPGCGELDDAAATGDHEVKATQAIDDDKPGREVAGSGPASWERNEAVSESVEATPRTDDTSVHSVSSANSHCSNHDGRGSVAVEASSYEGGATEVTGISSIDNTIGVGETEGAAVENTEGVLSSAPASETSSGSRSGNRNVEQAPFNHVENDRGSPPPRGGEDIILNVSAPSSSPARAMANNDHAVGEAAVEDDVNELLFDGDRCDIMGRDEVLGGDKGVVQDEYRDDFDDEFEDEGG